MRTVTDYNFGVIPMFLLMGAFVSNSGMSRECFRAANCFSAICAAGSACDDRGLRRFCRHFAAHRSQPPRPFSAVAYPEMRRFGYPQSFATG
jgi:TRAP-type C4-dicarboxylate transport system permease large subunit